MPGSKEPNYFVLYQIIKSNSKKINGKPDWFSVILHRKNWLMRWFFVSLTNNTVLLVKNSLCR